MAKNPGAPLKNIDSLVKGNGDITIGRIGPILCAAVAADGDQQLAALVRRPKESLQDLLARLDAAIERAWEDDVFLVEING
jgi:hypothetical protein